MISVIGQENMTLAELALFHARHDFSFLHGLLVVGGKGVNETFSINTLDNIKLIDELYMSGSLYMLGSLNHKQKVLNVLTNAEHKLKELNGLTVADEAAPEDTFILDEADKIALIREAICSPDKSCNTNNKDCP